jgi:rhodanese-related sulfurtransferase
MATTTAELVREAKAQIENLDVETTARQVADGALLIDVREGSERDETGAIPGALHVPRGLLEFKADPSSPIHHPELMPTRRTILYCAVGGRSALAVVSLGQLGYTDVAHLDGGFQAWRAAGRQTEIVA